jgi:VanZ family protein
MPMTRRMLWVLTGAYWLVLFTLTHLPPELVTHGACSDNLHHFSAYGVLSFAVGASLWQAFPSRRRVIPLLVLLVAGLYGGFDEITQIFVGRDCELNDWLADISGAAFAGAVLYALQVYAVRRARGRDEGLAAESA